MVLLFLLKPSNVFLFLFWLIMREKTVQKNGAKFGNKNHLITKQKACHIFYRECMYLNMIKLYDQAF